MNQCIYVQEIGCYSGHADEKEKHQAKNLNKKRQKKTTFCTTQDVILKTIFFWQILNSPLCTSGQQSELIDELNS